MEPDPDRSSGRASLQELSGGERGEKGEGLHCLDNAAIDEELCVHADQLLTAGGEGRHSGTTGPPIPVLWARNTTTATSMVVWLCNGSTPSTPVVRLCKGSTPSTPVVWLCNGSSTTSTSGVAL